MTTLNRRQALGTSVAAALALAGFCKPALAGTEEQAKAMVAKAIALYDEKGEAALATFSAGKASGFQDGEIYIVVLSRGPEGKVLAHAANPKLYGMPLETFAVIMSAEATEAGGWFDYEWPHPSTGKLGQKKGWVVLHKDLVFLAGFYIR
ncbi:hypothetical protein [Aestuariivirga sp.]|uniref:cache domain-containing protein n=1 Tax=Aestuariivirga sp. TaxID=2650926 RepID=UPI003017179C